MEPAKFEGLLSFDYDGVVVGGGCPPRRPCSRGGAAHRRAQPRRRETFARRLEKAGVPLGVRLRSARYTRRLSETRGEDIAFRLPMEGWFVEFDGHLLRTAGDLSIR
ncbi:MAG: hypothetical protein IPK33_25760 [Gemmatimonadetes bacterium]|nr:hypothetical protein [Gemmatimonadota bacterium]